MIKINYIYNIMKRVFGRFNLKLFKFVGRGGEAKGLLL